MWQRIRRRLARWLKRLAVVAFALTLLAGVALAAAWWAFPFPLERLENQPVSPVVTDAGGHVMLQRVAADGQWRLPRKLEQMSPWLIQATVAVEDERYYDHPGVDPIAVLRAAAQNVAAGRVVSGASTIPMQVCRMMDDRPRTLWAKLVESFRALQLSALRDKDEVLELYLNMAPYGGNLRGSEAASRRYFGKRAADLSLAEAALLAGVPQSPSRLRPDRYRQAARARRNHVLRRMHESGMITQAELARAQAEPVAPAPHDPARPVPHVAWLALRSRPAGGRTIIDPRLQAESARLAADHRSRVAPRAKVAVVVIDIHRSALVAMVGSGDPGNPIDGQVNGALARRSPGSALKPLVYAAAFEAGRLSPDRCVYDVPIQRAGWAPRNFNRDFHGAISAAEALRRSLNVPAILVAEGTGLDRCLGLIEAVGIELPPDARRRGGLAVAVGALEVTLLDLTNAYATLGRGGARRPLRLFADQSPPPAAAVLDANVCAALDEILSSRSRRPSGLDHLSDPRLPWFMWKTGTSAGRRDAWAVGHNRRYAIGVWVGRFSGTGRVEFVGRQAAEPLLAALFDLPGIRSARVPRPARPILVRHPLPPPAPLAAGLRILTPTDGDTFLALSGRAVIHAAANRTGGVNWFLNGRLIDPNQAARLCLSPGTYELRCVADAGPAVRAASAAADRSSRRGTPQASAVRFRVR